MFNPKILTAMKQKLKKIGVLAVLLAMEVLSQVGKAQRTVDDISISGGSGETTATEECRDNKTVCIKCGGSCIVLCCDKPKDPVPTLGL
jgi:hypothetical protein